jgi:hypothetical protein
MIARELTLVTSVARPIGLQPIKAVGDRTAPRFTVHAPVSAVRRPRASKSDLCMVVAQRSAVGAAWTPGRDPNLAFATYLLTTEGELKKPGPLQCLGGKNDKVSARCKRTGLQALHNYIARKSRVSRGLIPKFYENAGTSPPRDAQVCVLSAE